jgi:hypothetical protein
VPRSQGVARTSNAAKIGPRVDWRRSQSDRNRKDGVFKCTEGSTMATGNGGYAADS